MAKHGFQTMMRGFLLLLLAVVLARQLSMTSSITRQLDVGDDSVWPTTSWLLSSASTSIQGESLTLSSSSSSEMSSQQHSSNNAMPNGTQENQHYIAATQSVNESIQSNLHFIMHIGPPKTGTTTIQCLMQDLQPILSESNHLTILETESCRPTSTRAEQLRTFYNITSEKYQNKYTLDNVRLGRAFLPGCLRQWTPRRRGMPRCWNKSYLRAIREQQQEGRSTIVSNENLMQIFPKTTTQDKTQFLDDLLASLEASAGGTGRQKKEDKIQLVVLVTYRRWFEWAKSLHAQENQLLQGKKAKLSRWPQKRGRPTPTLESYLLSQINTPAMDKGYIDTALSFFSGRNVNLRVINFHHNADMGELSFVESFFCNALPTTTTTHVGEGVGGNVGTSALCKSAQEKSAKAHQNPSREDYVWADHLATAAQESGLVPITASRVKTVRKILTVHSQNTSGLKLPPQSFICPSQETYDMILEKSLDYERMVAPYLVQKSWSSSINSTYASSSVVQLAKMELQHRQAFQRLVRQKELCSLNTTVVLEDDTWRSFLASIQ
jgi:hypothetical protein